MENVSLETSFSISYIKTFLGTFLNLFQIFHMKLEHYLLGHYTYICVQKSVKKIYLIHESNDFWYLLSKIIKNIY